MQNQEQDQPEDAESKNGGQTPVANAGIRETPAFEFITVDSISANGGIESPFVSNTKVLVKYGLSQEII